MGKRVIIFICVILAALGILVFIGSCRKTTLLTEIQGIIAGIGRWDEGTWDDAKWDE